MRELKPEELGLTSTIGDIGETFPAEGSLQNVSSTRMDVWGTELLGKTKKSIFFSLQAGGCRSVTSSELLRKSHLVGV